MGSRCPSSEHLARILDGDWSPDHDPQLHTHLRQCSECAAIVLQSEASPSIPAAPDMPRPGQTLGRYRIGEPLGRGAMGRVWSAFDPVLGRTIALKVVTAEVAARTGADDIHEARALARVRHPHVAAVHDAGRHHAWVYIAMEAIEGQHLDDWSAGRRWSEILDRVIEAGRGLAAIHRAGLVHCDIKPANVLVDAEGRAQIVDLGLALPIEASNGRPGVAGTVAYMAPEQREGRGTDARSDQFSLCLMAAQMLGLRPVLDRWVPVQTAAPRRLSAVLTRGLSPDPTTRWPNLDALVRALQRSRRRHRAWLLPPIATTGALAVALASTPDRCERGRTTLATVHERWPAAATEDTRARDGFEQAWAQRWDRACTARPIVPPATQRTIACLEEALEQTQRLTLAHADPSRWREGLPNPSWCDQSRPGPQPAIRDPQRAVASAQIRVHLGAAITQEKEGDYEGAGREVDRAVALAQRWSLPWLRAQALYRRASVMARNGRVGEAERVAIEAAVLARAASHYHIAARASLLRMFLLARRAPNDPEADIWLAFTGADVLETRDPGVKAEFHSVHGTLLVGRGDYHGAVSAFERAVDVSRDREHSPARLATALANLAEAHKLSGSFAAAIEAIERAIEVRRELEGERHPRMALLYASLGSVHLDAGRPERARSSLLRARGT
ncbi:MAG: serine/threonine-protein kinase, partial [Deltaproteobacteria bacterium]|nr:serine/threonine-protein kinase [Deltaproteobacteria bacterium]